MTKEKVTYSPLATLFPSQVRFSQKNVVDKIQRALKNGDAVLHPSTKTYECRFDQGRSIFSLSQAIPLITTTNKIILADGHHSVLASLALGCTTIPAKVIATWPGQSDASFWQWAEEQNYAYLFDLDGTKLPAPSSFADLKDDPLRYFAAITARKFEFSLDVAKSSGIDYPLWVKIGKDIPFMEMRIANVLYQAGFVYEYGQENTPSFTQMIEEARQILHHHSIAGLKFLPHKEHYLHSGKIQEWLTEADTHA